MKTLYIECNMGAAGDMLMSALLELHPNAEEFLNRLNKLGIPNVTVSKTASVKCGITGTHIDVNVNGEHEDEHMHDHHDHHHDHHHHHHHTGMHEIEHIIEHFDIPEKVRTDILAVYHLIAEVDKIIASPIHVGCGQVQCAHGILPVPAPATAYILKDIPIYGGNVQGELCTPTGAALLAHFADEFGNMPVMRVSKIGYGMGAKDFETANCVRVMLGETESEAQQVLELKCNIDDMTAEEIGYATEQLLKLGAVDVFTVPIGMKKNRPGTLLSCICKTSDKETMVNAIFRYTSTIGIRQNICERYILDRTENTVKTKYGDVRVKQSEGYGVKRVKAEYDNVARIADELGISINETRRLIGEELEKNEQQV